MEQLVNYFSTGLAFLGIFRILFLGCFAIEAFFAFDVAEVVSRYNHTGCQKAHPKCDGQVFCYFFFHSVGFLKDLVNQLAGFLNTRLDTKVKQMAVEMKGFFCQWVENII